MILTDEPIRSAADDEVELSLFVRRLLRPLIDVSSSSSVVLGLYGPWGQGKTSALNLLEAELKATVEGKTAVVVRFNPWLYGDSESLLLSFFGTLSAVIGGGDFLAPEQKRKLAKAIEGLAAFVVPVLNVLPIPALVVATLRGGAAAARSLLKGGEKSYRERKQEVGEILRSLSIRPNPLRVIVLIDDLDRANSTEILSMLRVVKLIADLPNTSYVLSMDDRRVREVLSESRNESFGADYLEKIVQVTVHLPPISSERLQDLVLTAVDSELAKVGLDAAGFQRSKYEGGLSYHRTLGRRVRTLRDRARLINSLRFTLQAADRQLDLHGMDAVLVSFLQTFFPDVYDRVRRNKSFLTAVRDPFEDIWHNEAEKQKAAEERSERFQLIATGVHQPALQTERSSSDSDVVLRVLRYLFPWAEVPQGGTEDDRAQARVNNRVREIDRFDRYFQLCPPEFEVSDDDIKALLRALPDAARNADRQARIDRVGMLVDPYLQGDPRLAASFQGKVMDHLTAIDPEQFPDLARSFIAMETRIGAARAADYVNEILALISRTDSLTPPGPEKEVQRIMVDLMLDEVKSFESPVAIDLADDYSRGALSFLRDPTLLKEIAAAGITRARELFSRTNDVFSEFPGASAVELLWNWHRLSIRSGADGSEVTAYLRSLLQANPRRLSEVLSMAAAWSNDKPRFGRMQSVEEALSSIGKFFSLGELVAFAAESEEWRLGAYPALVESLLEYAARARNGLTE